MKVKNIKIGGSRIATYKITAIRMLSVTVLVDAGAWYEKENESGCFHLLEHLMMTGTEKFSSFTKISQYKEKFGIRCGASTSRNNMEFWFDFPDIYLKEGFELVGEILFHSKVNFDNYQNEIAIIKQEYLDAYDDPYKKFGQKIERKMVGEKCNLINDVLGEPENFMKATQTDLKGLYQMFFSPNRMCWGISGNYKYEELLKILNKIIPHKKIESKEEFKVKNFEPSYGQLIIESNKIQQASGRMIWQLPEIDKEDAKTKCSLNMINYLIGNSANSILFHRIRQELGLVYRINSTYWYWPSVSYFEIYFSCEKENVDRVMSESLKLLNEFLGHEIGKEKYLTSRNYLDLGTFMSFSSPTKISYNMAASLFYENKAQSASEINREAHKINLNKFREWMRKNMDEKKTMKVSVLPKLDQSGESN